MVLIDCFEGEFAFLSNFFDSPIEFIAVDGSKQTAPTVEHYFQASKAMFAEEQKAIVNAPTPGKSKRLGRHCLLRPDWEDVKDSIMREALVKKFADPTLRKMLLKTGDAKLVEGNHWCDNEWGNCSCEKCKHIQGKNKLGKLLMEIREEIRNDS